MSKEAYYFSHDANARNDPKILAMKSEFGISGYGVYWTIVEMLREEEEYKLPMKDYIFNAIAMQVQCKSYAKDDAKRFVLFCINECELFESDDTHFWSNSLMKRMEKRSSISEKRSEAAKKRWNKPNDSNDHEKDDDANAMQTNANAMQSDARKGKEKKGKEKKDIKEKEPKKKKGEVIDKIQFAEFVHLKQSEYDELVNRFGETGAKSIIAILDNYKGATGKKYVSDYRAMLTWVIKRYEEEQLKMLSIRKQKSSFDVFEEMRKEIGDDEQRPNVINHPINNNVLPKL